MCLAESDVHGEVETLIPPGSLRERLAEGMKEFKTLRQVVAWKIEPRGYLPATRHCKSESIQASEGTTEILLI